MQLNQHEILKEWYDVMQAIEECGASEKLTDAVVKCGALGDSIKKLIDTELFAVDGWNNFCRVFELPEKYPDGYCFNGGHIVEFKLVDWFNPIMGVGMAAVSKEVWKKNVGEIDIKRVSINDIKSLIPYLCKKPHIKSGKNYLILCSFGASIVFDKNGLIHAGNI